MAKGTNPQELRDLLDYIAQQARSRSQPLEKCCICFENINSLQDYMLVPLGRAHRWCQEFEKTQREIRTSGKSE
jgi:hypothetical protein